LDLVDDVEDVVVFEMFDEDAVLDVVARVTGGDMVAGTSMIDESMLLLRDSAESALRSMSKSFDVDAMLVGRSGRWIARRKESDSERLYEEDNQGRANRLETQC
jgi:hypothetical protein